MVVCASPLFVFSQSLNPFYVLNECLGPALCRKLGCVCCCLLFATVLIFCAPFLEIVFALPEPIPHAFVSLLLVLFFGPPLY